MTNAEALAFLHQYGLDRLLTAADDPHLWAAAVAQHWPLPPLSPDAFPRTNFGVGRRPQAEKSGATWEGLDSVTRWHLKMRSDGSMVAVQGAAHFPAYFLEVSQPSVGVASAWVHAGSLPGPLVGEGYTALWERNEDGQWTEATKLVQWIS